MSEIKIQVINESQYEVVKFVKMDCASCAMVFMVTDDFKRRRQEDGKSFYCPNGHSQAYQASDIGKLKQELEKATSSAAFYRNEYYKTGQELSVKKGQLTKLKNRVANGVCPCCNRSFQNLHNHIKSQHPTFKTDEHLSLPPAKIKQPYLTSPYALSTSQAIQKIGKSEFTVQDFFDFLKKMGVNRPAASVINSLAQSSRLVEVSGTGMNRVYRIK